MAAISIHDCSICCETYKPPERRPMVLRCGHTFCEQCIEKVRQCSTCKAPIQAFAVNYALCPGTDPGQNIATVMPAMVVAVKQQSAAAAAPVAQQPSEEDQFKAYLQACRDCVRTYMDQDTGIPHGMMWDVRSEIDGYMKPRIEEHAQHFSGLCMQAKFICAMAALAQTLDFRFAGNICPAFEEVAQSELSLPADRAGSRFMWAHVQLNRGDFGNINYAKARELLSLVENDAHALPVHRLMAKFYRALLFLKGSEGLAQSYIQARLLLARLVEENLPYDAKKAAILFLAEMHILGLGGLEEDPVAAVKLLTNGIEMDQTGNKFIRKMTYWQGVFCLHGTGEVIKSFSGADNWFNHASNYSQEFQAMSVAKKKKSLEEIFLRGNFCPARTSYDDNERGPFCEEFLSWHLDPADYTNAPGNQAERDTCIIL